MPAQKRHGDRLRDCRILCGGRLKETSCFFFLCQQQFDLTLQVDVSAACNVKESFAGFVLKPQSLMEDALNSPPTFLVHGNSLLFHNISAFSGDVGWRSYCGFLDVRKAASAICEIRPPVTPQCSAM